MSNSKRFRMCDTSISSLLAGAKPEQWDEPEDLDLEKRMRTYMEISSASTWKEARKILANVFNDNKFYFALAINDTPEIFRHTAINQLNPYITLAIKEIIKIIHLDNSKYDPHSVFPIVATKEFIQSLPDSARDCNICRAPFKDFEDIIWKSCKKHVLHTYCLRQLLEANEVPIYGPCGCNTAGYGANWPVKMPELPLRNKKAMLVYDSWQRITDRNKKKEVRFSSGAWD